MKNSFRKLLIISICFLILASGSFAAGSSYTKQLTANYVGIQLVVDGTSYVPKDAKGNVVDPFIVDGTTYLPVRAVAEALGKEVNWDGETKTVYIGAMPADRIAVSDADNRPQRTGSSTYSISVDQFQIQIPSYWNQDTSVKQFKAYTESNDAMLGVYSVYEDQKPVGFDWFDTETERNENIQSIFDEIESATGGSVNGFELTSTEVIEISDGKGILWSYRCIVTGIPSTCYTMIIPSVENNHWFYVECVYLDSSEYRYDDSFREIVSSIKKTATHGKTAPNIRSDIKDLLDSYERFIDEYIAFMQRYSNADSEDMLSMLGDYYNLIIQLGEFEEKVYALDESDLTTAEWAYYLEVLNRVNQKLLSVGG